MSLHRETFNYLKPTDGQTDDMNLVREAALDYAQVLDTHLPEGPDKTYVFRLLRTVNMWAMVSITREANGAPRT